MRCTEIGFAGLVLMLAVACSDSRAEQPSGFVFVDVAAERGVDVVNRSGDPRRWYIPESNGSGAAWIDHDGDGDMDLFVANGAGLIYHDDGARLEMVKDSSCRLYQNDGTGHFEDVTRKSGAGVTNWVNAVVAGDIEGDGDTDLYLACFGPDVLLRNEGGRFVDATRESGLGAESWSSAAAFADPDNDGDLDLYVAGYCEFDLAQPPDGGKRNAIEGVEIGWGPEEENKQGFNPGAEDIYYTNDGTGSFREATRAAGLELEKPLCSYACLFSDIDGDGWQDLVVANDLQASNLFVNVGDGTFEERGVENGFAYDANGKPTGAMGLCAADFDADGDMDIFRTNFDFEANSLHVNDGKGRFRDRSAAFGLAEPSMDRLGWGCAFFDADLDGDLDLIVANGHVYPQAERIGMSPWLQASQLFEARSDAEHRVVYRDVTARAGKDLSVPRSARGLTLGDMDDDGDLDVVLVDIGEPPRLLENRSKRLGHWISVRTVGTISNRDGFGARVTLIAGGRRWVREVRGNDGLFSSHDPRLHFGLGDVQKIDAVEVSWPSGAKSRIEAPAVDSFLTITEKEESR